MKEYKDIVLFTKEYLYLSLSWITPIKQSKNTKALTKHRFIEPIYNGDKIIVGSYHLPKSSGTYRITENGKRYLKYSRKTFYNRYLTPIVVSVLTNIAIWLLLWLSNMAQINLP